MAKILSQTLSTKKKKVEKEMLRKGELRKGVLRKGVLGKEGWEGERESRGKGELGKWRAG